MQDSHKWQKTTFESALAPMLPIGLSVNDIYINIQPYTKYTHARYIPPKNNTVARIDFLNKPFLYAYKFPTTIMHLNGGELYFEVNTFM